MRDRAVAFFAGGLAAVAPGVVVTRALELETDTAPFTRLIALGKAALPMAKAADAWQHRTGRAWDASLVVCPADAVSTSTGLTVIPGDHPVPGPHSRAAAGALSSVASGITPRDRILVLLSGGTTSLVGAPVEGVSPSSLKQIFRMLLASGLDIHAANQVRKRFLVWGGGRLAQALMPGTITALAISDVMGNDAESIGSGPLSPDSATAGDVRTLLARHALTLPGDARLVLGQMEDGERPETAKPGAECFARVNYGIIASNHGALDAAAAAATAQGFHASIEPGALAGEASVAGAAIARRMLALSSGSRRAVIWGGETTVTLSPSPGVGGRNQELALAAARLLDGTGNVLILAAGTDGRDGASGNAGAIVDGDTWRRIPDASAMLGAHDSTTALSQAGAVLRTGPTGTNVMDVVIALRW